MKHLFKTILGLSIVALLTVFISCPQTADPNPQTPGDGTNSGFPSNPQTPTQTPVEKPLPN